MKKSACILICILFITSLIWSEEKISLEGYYKNFSIFFNPPPFKIGDSQLDEPDMGAVNNRIRLKLAIRATDWLSFHAAYDLSPRIQDTKLFEDNAMFAGLTPLEYRFSDFQARIYPKPEETANSFGLFHNLDRFFFTINTKFADIYIGRQAIAWGNARVINPTDVIAPFAFNELDTEERRGVDALRIRIPVGIMDELDFGFIAGDNFDPDNNAFYARGKIYVLQTDLSFLLLNFRKHLLVGFDITRALGAAGFWLEAAYVVPEYFRKTKISDDKNYIRASIGLDYNLTSKMYGFVEYHFNSAGKDKTKDYSGLFTTSAYKDGSVYLMGKHYLNAAITYQLSPLIPFIGMVIYNISDGSYIFSPVLEYNIAENIYLSLGAYVGTGKNPELILGPLDRLPYLLRSEFGTYPDMIFTSFRVYF